MFHTLFAGRFGVRPPRCCQRGSEILPHMSCSGSPRLPRCHFCTSFFFLGKTHKTQTISSLLLCSSRSPLALFPRTHVTLFHHKCFICHPEAPALFPCGLSPFLHLQARLTEDDIHCCCLGFLSTDSFSRLYLAQLLLRAVVNSLYLGVCPWSPGLFAVAVLFFWQLHPSSVSVSPSSVSCCSSSLSQGCVFPYRFPLLASFLSLSCCCCSSLGQNFCRYLCSHFIFLILIARLPPGFRAVPRTLLHTFL